MRSSQLWFTIGLLVLVSTPAQAQASTAGNPLADTEWRLMSFGGGRAEIPLVRGTTITLKFSSDGRAGGSTGCNSYSGDYRVNLNSISFGRFISTRRACADARANQQEQRYLRVLGSARTFSIDGISLTISAGTSGTLNFVQPPKPIEPLPNYEDLTNPVALIASFYNAVNSRAYERAHGYWETPPGALEDFSRGYRETVKVQLIVQPPTRVEGAAGSLYAEVPAVIIARQRNGSERIFGGCYVTRQTNQGNASEGIWRIYRGNLSPVATVASIPRLLDQACR